MMIFHDIPRPSASELEQSYALSKKIKDAIDKNGDHISFSTFMDMALYQPKLGFYQANNLDIGRAGNFTTAPEISPLFAQCFALQCREIWDALGTNAVLELGAGTGRFAKDFLAALEKMNSLPTHYYIYEPSVALREKQKKLLSGTTFTSPTSCATQIIWLDDLPSGFKGIIIANEVLDALPTHCFLIEYNVIKERCVSFENDHFVFSHQLPTTSALQEEALKLSKAYALPNTYASEINLEHPPFIKKLSDTLKEGVILFADYGYSEAEYYHPDRSQGTLTSFYKHRQYNHPLWYPGLFDITSHVNFTQIASASVDSNLNVLGYTFQASFLLACGIMDFAKDMEKDLSQLSQKDEFDMHQAIKLLTFPTEMGERCKVMALGKGVDLPLRGLMWHDRRRDL